MTNKEQAKAIAKKYEDFRYDWDDSPVKEYEKIALEMAERKDNQFKEYLEKKRKKYLVLQEQEYQETKHYQSSLYYAFLNKANAIDEIINELFKEE